MRIQSQDAFFNTWNAACSTYLFRLGEGSCITGSSGIPEFHCLIPAASHHDIHFWAILHTPDRSIVGTNKVFCKKTQYTATLFALQTVRMWEIKNKKRTLLHYRHFLTSYRCISMPEVPVMDSSAFRSINFAKIRIVKLKLMSLELSI